MQKNPSTPELKLWGDFFLLFDRVSVFLFSPDSVLATPWPSAQSPPPPRRPQPSPRVPLMTQIPPLLAAQRPCSSSRIWWRRRSPWRNSRRSTTTRYNQSSNYTWLLLFHYWVKFDSQEDNFNCTRLEATFSIPETVAIPTADVPSEAACHLQGDGEGEIEVNLKKYSKTISRRNAKFYFFLGHPSPA